MGKGGDGAGFMREGKVHGDGEGKVVMVQVP